VDPAGESVVIAMIYLVKEWYDSDCGLHYFDDSKVDPSKPFEVAYLKLLQKAAQSSHQWHEPNRAELATIDDRFGTYQDGSPEWERLCTHPPCHVDIQVTLTMC
jgi:hypothetical protein